MATAKRKPRKEVADDVLTDEEIAAAAAAAEAVETIEEADLESAVAEVETKEAKRKTYAKKGKAEKSAKSKKDAPKKAKKEAAPRMNLETHKASEIVAARLGTDGHALFNINGLKSAPPAKLRELQAEVMATVDGLDKKTREKAINLFTALAAEKRPSVYTVAAAKFLQKNGSFTLKSLTDHFLEAGYKIGTARRQAGEMVALFPAVGIATFDPEVRPRTVEMNDRSTLLELILAS